MYIVYYAESNRQNRSSILGYFKEFDDAVLYGLDFYITNCDDYLDIKEFLSNSKEDKINLLKQYCFVYIEEIKDNSGLLKVDFNLINNIDSYEIVNNLIVTNIGIFKASEEEIEKFEKLILFK